MQPAPDRRLFAPNEGAIWKVYFPHGGAISDGKSRPPWLFLAAVFVLNLADLMEFWNEQEH